MRSASYASAIFGLCCVGDLSVHPHGHEAAVRLSHLCDQPTPAQSQQQPEQRSRGAHAKGKKAAGKDKEPSDRNSSRHDLLGFAAWLPLSEGSAQRQVDYFGSM